MYERKRCICCDAPFSVEIVIDNSRLLYYNVFSITKYKYEVIPWKIDSYSN